MFEDVITKDYPEDVLEYNFEHGTIIVDLDKREVKLIDKFTREDFKKACQHIFEDLGDESPIKPTEDGKWYRLDEGYVSCYPNGLSWLFINWYCPAQSTVTCSWNT